MKYIAFALALLTAGCGQPESKPLVTTATATVKPAAAPPNAEEARELINTSGEFSEYEFTHAAYTLPMAKAAMNPEALKAAADLKAAGWIRFDGGGRMVLTEKAKNDKRWLVRANDVVDLVPLGRKEVDKVTTFRPLPDGKIEADFDWHWITNEVGSAFQSGPVHDRYAGHDLHATATLMHEGSSWTVLKIVGR
jgi:hypothetical protein